MCDKGLCQSHHCQDPPQVRGEKIMKCVRVWNTCLSVLFGLLLRRPSPLQALWTALFPTSPSQPGSLSTSLGKMSARPGQAYACVIGTRRELQQSEGGGTRCQGRGRWHLVSLVTALRTLKPTLGYLSETRAAHKPSSPMLMATHPACNAMPTHELAETQPQFDSLCHLPVVTLH